MEEYTIVGVIPARGGSKGVKRKNIRLVKGKPLISYTIIEARKSLLLQNIYVSTEDEEIASIARDYGAEIIPRPEKFAEDDTLDLPVFKHAVEFLEEKGIKTDIIVNLRPTAPLREAQDIDDAIQLLLDKKTDSVRSFCEVSEHPYWMFNIKDGKAKPFNPEHTIKEYPRRQSLPKLYVINGSVDVMKTKFLKENSLYGEEMGAYLMSRDKFIDLDTEEDFKKLEFYLSGN